MTGAELQTALTDIGWTRGELARRLGVTPAYINALVWGKRPVPTILADRVRRLHAAVVEAWG